MNNKMAGFIYLYAIPGTVAVLFWILRLHDLTSLGKRR